MSIGVVHKALIAAFDCYGSFGNRQSALYVSDSVIVRYVCAACVYREFARVRLFARLGYFVERVNSRYFVPRNEFAVMRKDAVTERVAVVNFAIARVCNNYSAASYGKRAEYISYTVIRAHGSAA